MRHETCLARATIRWPLWCCADPIVGASVRKASRMAWDLAEGADCAASQEQTGTDGDESQRNAKVAMVAVFEVRMAHWRKHASRDGRWADAANARVIVPAPLLLDDRRRFRVPYDLRAL